MSVGFTTAAALVHELMEARDERRLLNLQRQLSRLNLLIIGELGFVPLSSTGAELLFEVFSQRYQRGSTLVTTNLPFDEWTEVFGSERLTGALLDRLTHHVHILEMNGESYRLKHSRDNSPGQAPDDLDNPQVAPEAILIHTPSLLPASRWDTSPEQLVWTFMLTNNAQVVQFYSAPLACFADALDTSASLSLLMIPSVVCFLLGIFRPQHVRNPDINPGSTLGSQASKYVYEYSFRDGKWPYLAIGLVAITTSRQWLQTMPG